MEVIKQIIEELEHAFQSVSGIATILGVCVLPFVIKYFLIKKAVKNGVKEAIEELKETEKE